MTTRMLTSTFGSVDYDSGIIDAGNFTSPSPSATFTSGANLYGTPVHDDVFYEFSPGVVQSVGRILTYDNHDLRDFLKEGKAMKNAMINIQRMKETPVPIECFNVTPLRNIVETIIVTNAALDMQEGNLGTFMESIFRAGFTPNFTTNANQGKLDDQREILYCERRVYGQDRGQEFSSPNEMGEMGDPIGGSNGIPTRWLNNWLLLDRTVTGQADMVIGPELQVIRFIQVFPFSRDNQNRTSGGTNNPAQELLNLQSRVYVTMPAFTINIIGEVMDLTATEKAVEYTNVYLSNQNLP